MKQGMASAVVLAAAVLLAPLVGIGAPSISPAAGTDAVLTMRGGPTDELRLQYKKDSGSGSTEDVSATRKTKCRPPCRPA